MSIKSIGLVLIFIGTSIFVHAQVYMSSPGFTGKHVHYKFTDNQYYDLHEVAPGLTYQGRVSVAWGLGYATYDSGLSGFSFSQRLSGLVLKQSEKMPISLGLNVDVQKSFIDSAIEGEDFPLSHFSVSMHYAYRSIDKMQFVPSVEIGNRQEAKFSDSENKYLLDSGYFTAASLTIGYTYFYVEPRMVFYSDQNYFQLSAGVFIP